MVWKLTVGGQLVDDARQIFGKLREQIILWRTSLPREIIDRLLANGLTQLGGRDRLVLAGSDPGFDDLAITVLLELT